MVALFDFDSIKDQIVSGLEAIFFSIFYLVEIIILGFLHLVEYAMEIFTGEEEIIYRDESMPLINVFFQHETVRGVYSGIAIIGIMFAFAFAIWSVIKRILDLRGKQQGVTMGTIIGNLIKSIVLIFSMTAVVYISIYTTNVLVSTLSSAIKNNYEFTQAEDSMTFTEEQYAAMGRIINTIGNYSLNPSYRSRYNLNACYNDIRGDLQFLDRQGVFKFNYKTYNNQGEDEETWQSVMQLLREGYSVNKEAALDTYDDGLTNAILDSIEILRANPRLRALADIQRGDFSEQSKSEVGDVPMDRILFLTGTMGTVGGLAAARDDTYNENPSFFDSVRFPFYVGDKSIYSKDDVMKVFTLSPIHMNYILVYLVGLALLREMVIIIITCGVRIFNLLALYIASPLAIASMPLDDGGKFKQWSTAFVVQLLGIVGMIISMRLFLVFLPIIWSPEIQIGNNGFDNVLLGTIVRTIITYCSLEAVSKVNGIFTGILADNAGYQAIYAGDMRSNFEQSSLGKATGKWMTGSGLVGAGASAVGNKIQGKNADGSKKEKSEAEKQADKREASREAANIKKDLDSIKKNKGKDSSGRKRSESDVKFMQHKLKHLEAGHNVKDSNAMAKEDMRQDKLDRDNDVNSMANDIRNMDKNDYGPGGGGIGGNDNRRQPPPGPHVDLPGDDDIPNNENIQV